MFVDWHSQPLTNDRLVFVLDTGEPLPGEDATRGQGSLPSATLSFSSIHMSLVADTLRGSVSAVIDEALRVTREVDGEEAAAALGDAAERITADLSALLAPLLSTTLYLCAANAEISAADGSERRPENPTPKRTKKHGERLFAAQKVREWDVAFRIGAALRRARADAEASPAGSGAGDERRRVRAHYRRAHWHTYWTGPRSGEQTPVLKWLPPIPVNVDYADKLPAVVRDVE